MIFPERRVCAPDEDFCDGLGTDSRSEKHIREIVQAVKGADCIFLASDPDREGEAIAWHVFEELARRKALKGVEVKRVTFNAITKESVMAAMQNPRSIDQPLVDAYMARRALDYLLALPFHRSCGASFLVAVTGRPVGRSEAHLRKRSRLSSSQRGVLDYRSAYALSHDKPFGARLTHLDGTSSKNFRFDAKSAEQRANAWNNTFFCGQY